MANAPTYKRKDKLMFLEFFCDGIPVPWKAPKFGQRRAYSDPRYRAWKQEVGAAARKALRKDWPTAEQFPTSNPSARRKAMKQRYRIKVEIYLPKGARRGDGDNYLKGINDALQDAGIFLNDRQIVCGSYLVDENTWGPGIFVSLELL